MRKYLVVLFSLMVFSFSFGKWEYIENYDKFKGTSSFYISNTSNDGIILMSQRGKDEFLLGISSGNNLLDGGGYSYIIIDDGAPEKFDAIIHNNLGVTYLDRKKMLSLSEKMKKGNTIAIKVENKKDNVVLEIGLSGFTSAFDKFIKKIK